MAFPIQENRGILIKTGGVSLILHIALFGLLSLNPRPTLIQIQPAPYTVDLMPISPPEIEIPKPDSSTKHEEVRFKPIQKPSPPVEKPFQKKLDKPKKEEIVEKVEKNIHKVIKKVETRVPPNEQKVPTKVPTNEAKVPSKHLQEKLEEIHKKAAIEKIQEKVARREKVEPRPAVPPSLIPSPPSISPPKAHKPSPPIPSYRLEARLNEYYDMIWAKIKEEWTIPKNLLKEKEMVDLETIVVVIIERNGKIQKSWFEKKSGILLYDQMAMRAIKKAEPLPSIPKELSENAIEIGIRFFPE